MRSGRDRADTGVERDPHRDRVPQWAEAGVRDAALEHPTQHERGIARRAAAGVVGAVGEHDRPAVERERFIERLVDGRIAHAELLAQADQLVGKTAREGLRLCRFAVGVDQHLGAHVLGVAPREAVRNRDRQDAVLALERLDPVDERTRRIARGVHRDQHLAVDGRTDQLDLAFDLRRAQVDQLVGALEDVGVRVLLERDQQVGVGQHRRRQVVVRIELGADHRLRADQRAHAGQQVALAVVVPVGDHRAVQAEHDHVDRQRRAQVAKQLVAQASRTPPASSCRSAALPRPCLR
jgi:hypothetical protein